MGGASRWRDLKESLLATQRKVSWERARYYTESWQATEGLPTVIRRARALEHILSHMEISIREHEILAGNRTVAPRSGIASPEMSPYWLLEELDTMSCRPQDPFAVEERDKQYYREVLYPYWAGKSLKDYITPQFPSTVSNAVSQRIISINQTDKGQGHIIPSFHKLLTLGLDGLLEEIHTYKRRQPLSDFMEAAEIALGAVQHFIGRYLALLQSMLLSQACPQRKEELQRMLCASRAIQGGVPGSFFEAAQLFWYFNIALQMESNASSISCGRFDQWMLPFYQADLARGVPVEQLKDTLRMLWIKMNDVVLLRSEESAKYFAGFPTGYTIILGGLDQEGNPCENELSRLILDTFDEIRLPQPNLGVRINERTSRSFLLRVCETIKLGTGIPHLFNDEVIIPALLAKGIPLPCARDYAIVGCVEISLPGRMYGLHDIAMFNSTILLEKLLTAQSESLASFQDLLDALAASIEEHVALMALASNLVDCAHGAAAPIPLLSTLMDSCSQRGLDVSQGGADFNFSGVQGIGFVNTADALEVIRQLVFEEHRMTLPQLTAVLQNNWQGMEPLRNWCVNNYPKYGNDHLPVDLLAARLLTIYCKACEQHRNSRGGPFSPGSYTVSANIPLGEQVGATADGRYRGEQLADGGLSPMVGRDLNGPTAVLNSVSRLDHYRLSNGSLLNLKFHPQAVAGKEGTQKLSCLLLAWMRLKIQHVQFNIVSREVLLDAQKHPEKHGDLVVRVAGYSALFVDLNAKTQNDIIARTEHHI